MSFCEFSINMSFEKQKFNNPEKQEPKERKRREMTKAESEQILGEMKEYIRGLNGILKEKRQELETLEENKKANPEQVESLKLEIQELEEQIFGLTEFSEEGKEEGAEFTVEE